jgi:hypothetical protein
MKNNLIIKSNAHLNDELQTKLLTELNTNLDVINTFFNVQTNIVLNIVDKETLDNIVGEVSTQFEKGNIPKWVDGFSTYDEIYIVTPNENTIDEIIQVATHEIVHLLSYKLDRSKKRLKLLDEGIAVYLSKQIPDIAFTNRYFQSSKLILDFCTYDTIEFAKLKGYQYSYFIVEFLLNKYGKEQFLYWIQNSDKFLENITQIEIDFNNYYEEKKKHNSN